MGRDASGNELVSTTDSRGTQKLSTSITLVANNTTAAVPLFRLTGTVEIVALYAVVVTALGSNVTAAYWRLNDQTAQVAISLATGTTLSSMTAGSTLVRKSLLSVALTANNASAGAVIDPVAATAPALCMPFAIVQKTGAIQTDVEFVYTTTNTPTSGVIQHFAEWRPMSAGSNLVAI